MSDLPKRHSEYDLIKRFEPEAWRRFVREKLMLGLQLNEVQDEFKGQFQEQKIQIFKKWKELDPKHNDKMFVKLKHDFFCTCYHLLPYPSEEPNLSQDGGGLEFDIAGARTPKQGCALIVANSFKNAKAFGKRESAKNDAEMMTKLWKETLKCDLIGGEAQMDQSAKQIKTILEDFSTSRKEYKYVVVVISTHGALVPKHWLERHGPESSSGLPEQWHEMLRKEDAESFTEALVGEDEKLVDVKEVKKLFNNVDAFGLRNIPKIFILQYCRGFKVDGETKPDGAPIYGLSGEYEPVSLMPNMSDVLVIYPTHESFVAYRNDQGSWLIQFLSAVFQENWKTTHVVDMMTMVNGRMKKKIGKCGSRKVKAMSIFESSLAENLYLFEQ